MTSGEITTMVCGILPSLAVFILQLRHGWANKQTAAKVDEIHRAVTAAPKCADAAHVKHVSTADQIAKGIAAQHHIHRQSK